MPLVTIFVYPNGVEIADFGDGPRRLRNGVWEPCFWIRLDSIDQLNQPPMKKEIEVSSD